ncbi:MAG: 2-oxoacid:acceptor oxidoreductase family protein [candidate division NC10 bacterium]|nr:2-oxoacid:acceptor oxidoreductase family protein [candidate division NC10 bacterium]
MSQMVEIRWHARAGQGAVTAAKSLAESALHEGKYVQAAPEYGPERAGAPLRAFNRISDRPIRLHSAVTSPQVVVVMDPTLIGIVDVTEGTPEDAAIIVNTPDTPAEMRKKMGIRGRKIFTVDATKIALETLGRPIPNTPMMAALIRATGLLKVENLLQQVEKTLGKKFVAKVVEGNLQAVKRAYEEVKGE